MEFKHSIRRKIRWLVISFTVTLSLFFIGLLILYAWVVEDNIFNRIVQDEASYVEEQFRQTGIIVSPRMPFMSLYRGWNELPEHIQLLRKQSPDRIEFPLRDGGTLHLKALQIGGKSWLLAANVTSYEVSKLYLPKIIPWILLVLLVMVSIAFVLARYLAHIVVNPLQGIAAAVAAQEDEEPVYFEQQSTDNEIGYLAKTLSNSFNRLHSALQRETDFSRDISHELRTPVAVLKMIAGRIDPQQPLDEASILKVKTAVREVEQTLSVLLALSREESIQTEPLSLLREVEHCIINHFALSHIDEVELDIAIPSDCQVVCNKNLLHMLLNNLLDNAVNHASRICITITFENGNLIFKNPVTEIPNEDVLAPQVKAKASQGLGQGLHLVRRICDKCGWKVSVNSEHNEFVLVISVH